MAEEKNVDGHGQGLVVTATTWGLGIVGGGPSHAWLLLGLGPTQVSTSGILYILHGSSCHDHYITT